MASRPASDSKIAAILVALDARHITGCVVWKNVAREWLAREFDVGTATQQTVNDALHAHVRSGGLVKVQVDHAGDFEEDRFYFAIVTIASREMYVKWVLHDDDPNDIRIRIVSFHAQTRA